MKYVQNIILAITLVVFSIPLMLFGQTDFSSSESRIALSIILPEQEETLPAVSNEYLVNKLKQAAVANGLAADNNFSRFFISASVLAVTKDIVPGPPQQIAQSFEVTLYIADYFDQKIFASTTFNIKGVGINDNKSYIDAIKHLNINSEPMKQFMNTGKQKIITYYNAQCENIIKQAGNLASQKQYEEAIYLLTSIPDVCNCYDKALTSTQTIFQQYTDYLCDVNLAKAKMAWAAEQNMNGAVKAGEYLGNVYPDAKCYNEAQSLYKDIKAKVLDDWKFEMKIYQDGIDLEKARINAWKAVGVAYGNHQQPVDYNINWLVR